MISSDFWFQLPILLLVGAVGGFMNAVAGGASLLTFPVLVFLGLGERVANATNNLATTILGLQAFFDYSRRGFGDRALTVKLAVPSLIGAIAGALGVIVMTDRSFSRLVGVLMLGALGVVLYNPGKRMKEAGRGSRHNPGSSARAGSRADEGSSAGPGERAARWRTLAGQGLFLLLGAYGGLFGGGIGMLILPVLVYFFDQDFLTGNGVKTGVVAVMNLTATAIFLYYGVVRFQYAIPLTLGMMAGGYIGVRWAVGGGERFIRPLLIMVTLIASVKFLFF